MDPNAAWDEMLDALKTGDMETAGERADDLFEWLEKEGFSPKGLPKYFSWHITATVRNLVRAKGIFQ